MLFSSVNVIGVELAKQFLVKRRALRLCNDHIEAIADLLDALSRDIKRMLILTDALDADTCLLVYAVANGPFDNSEIDAVSLTAIQALVESLGVEKMPTQANRESLQIFTL